jgi:ribosomal protein S18 acetylase RimI-like enzyme
LAAAIFPMNGTMSHGRMKLNDRIVIRRGQLRDIDPAVSVWISANTARNLANHPQHLRTWAQDPAAVLHVAEDHGQLIGMALRLIGCEDDGAGPPIPGLCHLTGICIAPPRQGQHLGGRLLDAVLAAARQDGYLLATLWTHQDNPRAYQLFKARGFQLTGRTALDESGKLMVHFKRAL